MMYLMSNALASFTAPFIIPCTINEQTPTKGRNAEKVFSTNTDSLNQMRNRQWMFGFKGHVPPRQGQGGRRW